MWHERPDREENAIHPCGLRFLLPSNTKLEVSRTSIWSASQIVVTKAVVGFASATYR